MQSKYNLRSQLYFKNLYGEPLVLTPGQEQIFRLIYEPSILRAAMKAITQYGKSEVASIAIISAMTERREKILIVSPSEKQSSIIMGKVITHLFDHPYLQGMVEYYGRLEQLRSERSKKRITTKNGSEVMILTANVEEVSKESRNLMGFGATMVIVDERPLIPDIMFSKILRMVGGVRNGKIVMFGNAFPDSQQFQKAFMANSRYEHLTIDWRQALAEGRVSQEFLNEAKEEMGELDWDIFYECIFPKSGADNAVLPLDWIMRAVEQKGCEGDFIQAGLDVARFGRDKTVYTFRRGGVVSPQQQTEHMDTMEVSGWVRNYLDVDKAPLLVDVVGIGSGVYDRLNELEYNVHPVNVGSSPVDAVDKEKFYNMRAQVFWNLRPLFKPDRGGHSQICIPNDPDLIKQLSEIKYGYSSEKKIKIEDKEEMKKRLGKSPDKADSLALAFADMETFLTETEPEMIIV